MSQLRQLDDGVLVRSYGVTFSIPSHKPPTSEVWDQLVYAIRGVLTVKTDLGTWVVPPHRAVWLPANTRHWLEMSGQTALRMIYLRKQEAQSAKFDRSQCAVVSVSSLLRELIVRTIQIGALESNVPHHRHLSALIEDEIEAIETVPLQLPYPQSEVALKFALALEKLDAFNSDWKHDMRDCGVSRRTLERIFLTETGMTLGQWIRRRKLLTGLDQLLRGETTAYVAFHLGYSSPSAFIAMFRRELGSTPSTYTGKT